MEKTILCEIRRSGSFSTDYTDALQAGIRFSHETVEKNDFREELLFTVENTAAEAFSGVIHFKVSVPKQDPKIFMPGYIYGKNTGEKPSHGRKDFPRIREQDVRRPESPFWMTRSDRLAEPVSLLYDGGRIVGIAGAPYFTGDERNKTEADTTKPDQAPFYQYSGFTCHVADHGRASVGYTLGYENAPWLFIQTATVKERAPLTAENCFLLQPGEQVHCRIFLYDYPAENETGIYRALQDVYRIYHRPPRQIAGMTVRKAVELLSHAISEYAWLPDEKMYSGFVYDRPEGFSYNKIGSLTWTNGLSVAVPMLMAANRLQQENMRDQALTFIEEVIAHSLNPASGFLYDAVENGKWSVRGWWYDGMHSGGHSAYLNGQALYYILKAYLSEKETRNIVHDDWLRFVQPVIARCNQVKNTDGEYPFSMSETTGAGLEYDSLGGVWCLAATALYSRLSGDRQYLEDMKKSEQHYYNTFIQKAECYGGPLDTDKAVDNEGILAYVRAVRILHELTGEKKYLQHLLDGMQYELSFKLGYDTPIQVKPLCDIGWSSCGGSITSTANPHIHPMSETITDELCYLAEHTGNPYISERLKDTVGWGLQTFNTYDEEYGYGRIGWMSERFCFCQGLVVEKYPDGTPAGTWFALMPWAGASIIEGLVGKVWDKEWM